MPTLAVKSRAKGVSPYLIALREALANSGGGPLAELRIGDLSVELPAEAISNEQRETNGYIDRALSFPLEDGHPDGQPAGQVEQEIYGAGAAFILATRSFHEVEDAPFRLFCDHFLCSREHTGDKALRIRLDGGDGCTAQLSLVCKAAQAARRQGHNHGGRRAAAACGFGRSDRFLCACQRDRHP